jgi:trk system potassium uptake protein TrkH
VNFRFVLHQLGSLLLVISALLMGIAIWALVRLQLGDVAETHGSQAFLTGTAVGGIVGGGLRWFTRSPSEVFGRREALLLVALSWLTAAALAAIPFWVWAHLAHDDPILHAFHNPVNCYFESMSGFTTTGATILTQISQLPASLLLWRAMTHWLGGLGIVVLFVAVLPSLGVGGKKLFRVEAPGPDPEGVRPHIGETARVLWIIYVGLTVAETIALRIAGMSWFDAVCHTFATLATGGFSTIDASVGGFHSAAVDIIIIVFMVGAGVNFGLYYQIIRGRWGSAWRDTEFRVYLAFLLVGAGVVILSIQGTTIVTTDGTELEANLGTAVRYGVFQTVSVQTTTGFCSADFNRWPFIAQAVMIGLMFVGGCGGSTGGGIKVIRIWIALKVLFHEVERSFRPQVVRPLKVGQATVDADLKLGILCYVLGVLLIFVAGAVLIMVLEPPTGMDFASAAGASVATLCNIGPGLSKVGAVENYAWFTDSSKLVLTLLMVVGRLEVFAIVVLFVPRFWRTN